MSNDKIIQQYKELLIEYPDLKIASILNDEIVIVGSIEINATYKEVLLYDTFNIKLCIPSEYPENLPILYELSDKIPAKFGHKNLSDGSCCLGVAVEIYEKFFKQQTLVYFFNEFVVNFFFSALWFIRFGTLPFGERPHDVEGIFDYYKEFWNINDKQTIIKMLCVAFRKDSYRGHLPCPCGSGKIGRICHGEQYKRIFFSPFKYQYYNDCLLLLAFENMKRGKKL